MSDNKQATEEEIEELRAAFHKVKYSTKEVEMVEAAKFILNSHMDISGIRKILTKFQTSSLNAEDSKGKDKATDLAQASVMNVVAQLFINAYRMGALDQQREYREMVENTLKQKDVKDIIGQPAEEEPKEEK